MNIAEKLRKLREEKGISQNKLIEELKEKQNINVAISSIRNYENVKAPRIPQGDVLLALARYYDVTLEYLIDDNITTYKKENLNIGKELKLTDKSIENIKRINNEYYNLFDDLLNEYIFTEFIEYFLEYTLINTFRDEFVADTFEYSYNSNNKKIEYFSFREQEIRGYTLSVIKKISQEKNLRLDFINRNINKYINKSNQGELDYSKLGIIYRELNVNDKLNYIMNQYKLIIELIGNGKYSIGVKVAEVMNQIIEESHKFYDLIEVITDCFKISINELYNDIYGSLRIKKVDELMRIEKEWRATNVNKRNRKRKKI